MNVVQLFSIVEIISDRMLPKIALPHRTADVLMKTIDLERDAAFPIAHNLGDCPLLPDGEQYMDMVRHEDEAVQLKIKLSLIEIKIAHGDPTGFFVGYDTPVGIPTFASDDITNAHPRIPIRGWYELCSS